MPFPFSRYQAVLPCLWLAKAQAASVEQKAPAAADQLNLNILPVLKWLASQGRNLTVKACVDMIRRSDCNSIRPAQR